jgi:hypothetical protein
MMKKKKSSPSGIKKPESDKVKGKNSSRRRRRVGGGGGSDVVAKWLECVPREVMAVFVNMHEQYASSVNDLRAEMRFLMERLEGLERVGERLDVHEGLLGSVMGRLWKGEGDDGVGVGEGEDEVMEERGGDEAVAATSPLNMDVPPTPIGERQPIRSTGLGVARRRRRPGTTAPLALRQQSADRPAKPGFPRPRSDEETAPQQGSGGSGTGDGRAHNNDGDDDDDDDDDDEGLRILDGAPRLRALLRRQHGIASPPPQMESPPRRAHVEPDLDSDSGSDKDVDVEDAEYMPGSPSCSSESSSLSTASGASWAPEGSASPTSRGVRRTESTKGSRSAGMTKQTGQSSSTPKRTTRPRTPRETAATTSPASQQPPPSRPTPPETTAASPSPAAPSSKPRYSTPRRTTLKRTNSGPQYAGKFTFRRRGRTVLSVWNEYKVDGDGGGIVGTGKPFRCIESLEKEYGTCWRTGSVGDIKYASNYVGVRKKIVDFVEGMCEHGKMTPEEACAKLDERVDGRLQELITVLRKGLDPFKAIPVRAGKSVST